ncbi:hypothetical protein [Nocardia sp. alder85J]|uniref:hypothetical protein n=1 Tax=Nocardia sp. alder85J TaxID=2862949 RepID=UPI001CD51F30|nr:hypothetical protein [Nocardia sp. alder85J]MCX4097706.1 hypothetical protein [Nocardia sp. alder85J]
MPVLLAHGLPAPRFQARLEPLNRAALAGNAPAVEWLPYEQLAAVWMLYRSQPLEPDGFYRASVTELTSEHQPIRNLHLIEGTPAQITARFSAVAVDPTRTAEVVAPGILELDDRTAREIRVLECLDAYESAIIDLPALSPSRNQWRQHWRTEFDHAVAPGFNGLGLGWARARLSAADMTLWAHPDGPFRAVLERPRPASAVTEPYLTQRFATARHAREWLRVVATAHGLGVDPTAQLQATVTEIRAGGPEVVRHVLTDRPWAIARALHLETGDFDGTYVTGVPSVDIGTLSTLVDSYRDLTGRLVNAEVYTDTPAPGAGAGSVGHRDNVRRDNVRREIEAMLGEPHLRTRSGAVHAQLALADRRVLPRPSPVRWATGTPSSGFLHADIQLACDQYQRLSRELPEVESPLRPMFKEQITQIELRLEQLLEHTATFEHRGQIHARLNEIVNDPSAQYEPLFVAPYPAEIRRRADELAALPPPAPGGLRGRDVDDALRLYQLTLATATNETIPSVRRGMMNTLSDQKLHLRDRITGHPLLRLPEKRAALEALATLDVDPLAPLPSHRVESLPPPLENLDSPASLGRILFGTANLRFTDPDLTTRELTIGRDSDRWNLNVYNRYPGHPRWFQLESATDYHDLGDLVQALTYGTDYQHLDRIQQIPKVQIPDAVAATLKQLRTRTTASPAPGTDPPHLTHGSSKPMSPENRRAHLPPRPGLNGNGRRLGK